MADPEGLAAMEQSLEAAGTACDDLTPLVYDRLFQRHPEMRALFNPDRSPFRLEERTRGRMLNEIISLLMALAGGEAYAQDTIDQAAREHSAYGEIPEEVYQELLDALLATLADLSGPTWTGRAQAAWRDAAGRLMNVVRGSLSPGRAAAVG